MKILVAEDDVANAKFLSKYLGKFGDVIIATDGIAAVDAYVNALEKGDRIDLVCLDIMMPKIDGYKVLASIRSAERKHGVSRMLRSKVIMTSALDEASFDSKLASDDYDDYICKPIDIVKFNNILKKLDII
jgi:two-component system chemotaxis response regulator CheY